MTNYYKAEEVKKDYLEQLSSPSEEWPLKVRQATDCIHENLYSERLTVTWMEDECLISNHNFSSRFAFYVGQTPKQYILHHRIETAKLVLSNENFVEMPISHVAFTLGFSSVSTFSKCFNRETGFIPTKWRKRTTK